MTDENQPEWRRPTAALEQLVTFSHIGELAAKGLEDWKSKGWNKKWWKRIDGTPIPNDLIVCIAERISKELRQELVVVPAKVAPAALRDLVAKWRRLGELCGSDPTDQRAAILYALLADELEALLPLLASKVTAPICAPVMGDGDYSCAVCGLGLKEPCEHWRQFYATMPVEGEATTQNVLPQTQASKDQEAVTAERERIRDAIIERVARLDEVRSMPEYNWPNAAGYEAWRKKRLAELGSIEDRDLLIECRQELSRFGSLAGPHAGRVTRDLLNGLEKDFCQCGAELDRHKPKSWEYCAIHQRIDVIRALAVPPLPAKTHCP